MSNVREWVPYYFPTEDGRRVYLTEEETTAYDALQARMETAGRAFEDESRAIKDRVLARAAAEAKAAGGDV